MWLYVTTDYIGDHIFAISMEIYYELSEYPYYVCLPVSPLILIWRSPFCHFQRHLLRIKWVPLLSVWLYVTNDSFEDHLFAISMGIYYELSEYPYYVCLTVSPLIPMDISFLPFPWTFTTN